LRRKFGEGIDDEVEAQKKACRGGDRRMSVEYARTGMRSDYEMQVVKQKRNVAEFKKQVQRGKHAKNRNKFVDIRAPCRGGDQLLVVTTLALCR
jgi:hypothetical protein